MDWIIPNWHPLLVHFTIALLCIAALLAIVAVLIRDADTRRRVSLVAEWNFWIGAVITVLTLLAGWQAFNTVAHDDPAHRVMLEHRNWAMITSGWVLIMVVWLIVHRRFAREPFNAVFAIIAVVLLGLLGSTAWHGGELVYRHGLGVMSLPDTGGHRHDAGGHHDADGGEDDHNGHGAGQDGTGTAPEHDHQGHDHAH